MTYPFEILVCNLTLPYCRLDLVHHGFGKFWKSVQEFPVVISIYWVWIASWKVISDILKLISRDATPLRWWGSVFILGKGFARCVKKCICLPVFVSERLKIRKFNPNAETNLSFQNLDRIMLAESILAASPVVGTVLCVEAISTWSGSLGQWRSINMPKKLWKVCVPMRYFDMIKYSVVSMIHFSVDQSLYLVKYLL